MTGWEALGGVFHSPPAAVSWGTDRLDILAWEPIIRCITSPGMVSSGARLPRVGKHSVASLTARRQLYPGLLIALISLHSVLILKCTISIGTGASGVLRRPE